MRIHVSSGRRTSVCLAAISSLALCIAFFASATPASAQTSFLYFASGNSGDTSGRTRNLTIDTNGTVSYSNTALVGSFSTTYDLNSHILGTISAPTNTGYTTTPVITTDATLTSYTGLTSITDPKGRVLSSELISSYSSETNNSSDAVGYYKDTITFTLSAASTMPVSIAGYANSDNEIQDAILDYGVTNGIQTGTVLGLSAQNGTEIRTQNNAKSNAYFSTQPRVNLAPGTHTLSIFYYNSAGPSDMSFSFGVDVLPEPGTFGLLFIGGLPLAGLIRRRKR